MEAAEVVEGGLVVAGGDATPVLDAVEGPLDDACVAVAVGVEGAGAAALVAAAAPVGQLVVAFVGMTMGTPRRRRDARLSRELSPLSAIT